MERIALYSSHKILSGRSNKENETGKVYGTHGNTGDVHFLAGNLKKRQL
jgi:hypothetical protein